MVIRTQATSGYSMASLAASSGGSSTTIHSQPQTTIAHATIDNGTYQYVLTLSWTQDSSSAFLRFYGCRIEYTVTTLSP